MKGRIVRPDAPTFLASSFSLTSPTSMVVTTDSFQDVQLFTSIFRAQAMRTFDHIRCRQAGVVARRAMFLIRDGREA
jgi:hypothetical protein